MPIFAGGNALCVQCVEHGLTRGLAGGGVIGGEGCLSQDICRRVDVDDLDACIGSFLQNRGDRAGTVGRDDNCVAAAGYGVIDLLDLLCIVLGVGSHEDELHARFGGSLFCALFEGDPVLVDGVHGDQRELSSAYDIFHPFYSIGFQYAIHHQLSEFR